VANVRELKGIAMKKITKQKLTLQAETVKRLRTLQQHELQPVAGGGTTFPSVCCQK
jgi:hypothetical protein